MPRPSRDFRERQLLFGEMPQQASEADFFVKTRASAQPAYRPTYTKWLKA